MYVPIVTTEIRPGLTKAIPIKSFKELQTEPYVEPSQVITAFAISATDGEEINAQDVLGVLRRIKLTAGVLREVAASATHGASIYTNLSTFAWRADRMEADLVNAAEYERVRQFAESKLAALSDPRRWTSNRMEAAIEKIRERAVRHGRNLPRLPKLH